MEDNGALRQTLAGCDASLTERFVLLAEQGQTKEGLALLALYRRILLERCHEAERSIDCLDYLVYQLEKNAKKGGISYG